MFIRRVPECAGTLRYNAPECQFKWDAPTSAGSETGQAGGADGEAAEPVFRPTLADVTYIARHVMLQLTIPEPEIHIGPDPSVNEWNMAVVGHPYWLWTSEAPTLSTTLSAYGMSFSMRATKASTTYSMGDGTTLTCSTSTPMPAGNPPGTPSPTCGHVYKKASLPRGTYTITATAAWNVNWSALGYTGTLPMTVTNSREVGVGELQAVVIR